MIKKIIDLFRSKEVVESIEELPKSKPLFDRIPEAYGVHSTGDLFSTHRITELDPGLSIQKGVKEFVDSKGAMDTACDLPCSVGMEANNPILSWYASQGFIGHQLCAILAQNWVINKACTMPAEDCVRKGYSISINSDREIDAEVIDDIQRTDQLVYQIDKQMIEYLRMGRIFGVRVAYYAMTDEFLDSPQNEDYYKNPFNLDSVTPGSYKGIVQIDPQFIAPILNQMASSDPSSQYYFEPTYWKIAGFRSEIVHRTHLCIMRNVEVPDLLKPTYYFGGIPLTQLIYERVYAAERLANEVPMLALTKRLITWKFDQAEGMLNINKLQQRMRENVANRNNFGYQTLGLEDDLIQHETNLNDLEPLLIASYKLCASIACIPFDKFMGESPGGLQASQTSQYAESAYHESLESLQETHLAPLLRGHHERMVRSYIMPKYDITEDFEVEVVFHPLDALTEKEQAEINEIKARTASQLIQSGAIDAEAERQRLIKDKDSGYEGVDIEEAGFDDDLPDEENLEG